MSAAKKHAEVHKLQVVPNHNQSLISPAWDFVMAGGLSVAMYILMSVSFQRNPPDNQIALYVFNLSFIFNFPHFLVSYQLLYGDFGKEIFKDGKFFWAAVCVPILLGGGMVAAFAMTSAVALGYFLNAMYFFVGWHYVKQTFGSMVVTNALRKTFYTATERFWLKANMYSLWAVSFFAMNTGAHSYSQMGIPYFSLNFPAWLLRVGVTAMYVSLAGTVITHVAKYIREGKLPGPTALISFAVIYIWLLPIMSHPYYAHMIPLFHSLQYLLFVYTFRRNKTESEIENPDTPEGRKKFVFGVWGYLLGAATLGALAFQFIPGYFDTLPLLNRQVLGGTPFVFFATIFINIHHYFIDNVIWRGNNPDLRKNLFRTA